MLHAMRNQTHDVWTGMCLHFAGGARFMGSVATPVEVGAISDDAIEHYLDTNQWQGKAGAYNLSERIDAGWPVTCHGEPEAVMGLSMHLLDQLLAEAAA